LKSVDFSFQWAVEYKKVTDDNWPQISKKLLAKTACKDGFQSSVQSSLCDWFILNETCQRLVYYLVLIDNLLMENIWKVFDRYVAILDPSFEIGQASALESRSNERKFSPNEPVMKGIIDNEYWIGQDFDILKWIFKNINSIRIRSE